MMPAAPRIRSLPVIPAAPEPGPAANDSVAVPTLRVPAGGEAVLVDVVVLTTDLELFGSAREAVGERNPVWRARSAEEAADLLITGRCGVLLVDMAAVSARADTFITQIVEQFPDVVVCVAGTRTDEPLLVPMISDGLVYRFMHKPATARRAGMFLQAAIRRHAERRDGTVDETGLALLRSLASPSLGIPRRYFVGFTLLALLGAALLFIGDDAPRPGPATAAVTESAATARYGDRADPVLSRARAALQAGRLEAPEGRNALDLFEAVLLVQPEQPEARAGLTRTVDLLLGEARRNAADGRKAEAERLLQRVLAVVPEHAGALALAEELNPPDLPSLQLAREQVAAVRQATPAPAAVAEPPLAPTPSRSGPLAEPVSAAFAARMAPVAVAPPAPRRAAVQSDPLAPKFANVVPGKRVASWRTARPANVPLPPPLPIAGYERAAAAGAAPMVETGAPAAAAMAAVPADEFDRMAAPDPVYPAAALRAKTRGWVELEFTITPTGGVTDIQVVGAEPNGVFEDAATTAIAQWRFRPRAVNGQPVSQRSSITLRFDVDD